jgi:hypothetical protein
MYQVVPLRWWVLSTAWAAVSVFVLIDWGVPFVEPGAKAKYVVLLINVALFTLTLKPVWRWLWKRVPALNAWFPDLNGEYDVELRHNWPIQQRLLEAAATGAERFDPRSTDADLPGLGTTKLRATIDLRFISVHVRMWAETPEEPDSVIDQSTTLATSLLRACDGQPHRLVYVYQQKNRRDRRAITDDSTFEGAALLYVPPGTNDELKGEYWTNRAWHQGLSTAGIIVLKRRR